MPRLSFPDSSGLGLELRQDGEPQAPRQTGLLLLLPSATRGQLKQLLLLYTTGHRDLSAQLFESSYQSANDALMC